MIKVWLFLFFIGCVTLNYAQRYSFVSYSTSEGLPQSQVNAIEQDSEGYLWIGTFGGVTKFNGNEFVNYTKSDGLLNNRVTHISLIKNLLYIGHNDGISIQLRREEHSFQAYPFPKNTLSANVTEIITFKDKIYLSTNGQGLFVLEDNRIQAIKGSPERIRGMVKYKDQLLLATRNGVYQFYEGQFNPLEGLQNLSYSSIHIVDDQILFTTFNGELYSSVYPFNQQVLKYQNTEYKFRGGHVISENEIWLNASSGAIKIENDEIIEVNESSGLPINDVTLVFEDRENNIWFGTGGKGLQLFSGETFTHFNTKSGLPSELIISSLEDQNGEFWLSSFDKGVFKFNPKAPEKSEKISFIDNIVWCTAKVGDLLFFGSTYGLYVYNETLKKWKVYYSKDGLPSNKITGISVINNQKLLIGTSTGVALYENDFLTPLFTEEDQILNVRDFAFIGDTTYFAGQKGVYQLYDNKVSKTLDVEGGTNSLSVDRKNNLWIGTESGLYLLSKDTILQLPLDERSGAFYINFILNKNDFLYVGTNNGLYEVHIETLKVKHFGISQGLVDLETNLNSASFDSNGNLWFGTVAGLMKMKLSKKHLLETEVPPLLHLTKIMVNFEDQIPFNQIGEQQIKLQRELKFNENNISFTFDGIFLSNPKGLSYTFQLEGVSEGWSPISKSNSLNFNNLPAGNHTLKIQVFVEGLPSNSDQLEIYFTITPPFYLTWWFYGIVAFFIVGILLLLDYFRSLRLKRKNYQEKLEFDNKLTQLEAQSLNASMNRHFIFNSLNSIQYYINSSDKVSANRYLTRFAKLIRKNLDSSNAKNGLVTLQDELDRLKLYLDLEMMRFRNKFDFSIYIDEQIESETLVVPAMFLQPFVENSIIHGVLPLKDKKGKIEVNITDHLDHIRIEIKDNGVGIDSSKASKIDDNSDHYSQGMLITKSRIDLLQKVSARSIELIGPHQIMENDHSIKGTVVIFKLLKQYLSK